MTHGQCCLFCCYVYLRILKFEYISIIMDACNQNVRQTIRFIFGNWPINIQNIVILIYSHLMEFGPVTY